MMTTVNVGFVDFCVSSPWRRLAEGAALPADVSQALVLCVHLAHRHGTWCEGGIFNLPPLPVFKYEYSLEEICQVSFTGWFN